MNPAAVLTRRALEMRRRATVAAADPRMAGRHLDAAASGRAAAYADCAAALDRVGARDGLAVDWTAASLDMARAALSRQEGGEPAQAAWCIGYVRGLGSAARLLTAHTTSIEED